MKFIKDLFSKITNGIILIVIGIMHCQLTFSPDVALDKIKMLSHTYFFKISNGTQDFPLRAGKTDFETLTAFWFFYFGLLLIPLGLLLHYVEKNRIPVPKSFTIAYLIVVLMGSYMIPYSGMTYFMLPHALFMVFRKQKATLS